MEGKREKIQKREKITWKGTYCSISLYNITFLMHIYIIMFKIEKRRKRMDGGEKGKNNVKRNLLYCFSL
jgi:hypothetical protein